MRWLRRALLDFSSEQASGGGIFCIITRCNCNETADISIVGSSPPCIKNGDMKLPYYLLLAAAVTPAIAQTQASAKSSLSYDRIAVGYTSDDALKGYNVTGSALLGNAVIISGIYDEVKAKDATFLSGNLAGFGLAYKFNVGPGDLSFGYTYKTGTISGIGQVGAYVVAGIAVAEQKGFNLNYRQAINNALEFSLGYARIETNYAFEGGAGNTYTGDIFTDAGVGSGTSNIYSIGLRYNITKNLDASLSYAFQGADAGGNKMGVSVGYNF